MNKGGLLDKFPLHLFAGGSGSIGVIVDSRELGRLHLDPLPEGRSKVIIISPNWECLEKTRDFIDDLGMTELLLLQADLDRIPLTDNSVNWIVTLPSANEILRRHEDGWRAAGVPDEFTRILCPTSWVIEIRPTRHCRRYPKDQDRAGETRTQDYYVRPASGREYFVTREWVPSSWPFKSLQLGRGRSIRLGLDLLLSRIGMRRLYDSARLMIHSRTNDGEAIIGTELRVGSHFSYVSEFGLFVKPSRNALLLGDGEAIVKFPLTGWEDGGITAHTDNIMSVKAYEKAVLASLLPTVLERGTRCGQAYHIETRLKGVAGTKFSWMPGWRKGVAKGAFDFLVNIHRLTSRQRQMVRSLFDDLVEPHVATVQDEARKLDPAFGLKPLVEVLWRSLGGKKVPLVRTHGDFWPGNFLICEGSRLAGVLDWDRSREQGWPMIDLLHLLAFQRKWRAVWHFGSVVTGRLLPKRLASWERQMVEEYCSVLNIEEDLWTSFVAVYWLDRMAHRIHKGIGSEEKWVRRDVIEVLPRILKEVDRSESGWATEPRNA